VAAEGFGRAWTAGAVMPSVCGLGGTTGNAFGRGPWGLGFIRDARYGLGRATVRVLGGGDRFASTIKWVAP
jgi:hypothetical protein